jgi:SAM-dependent methyltransferase
VTTRPEDLAGTAYWDRVWASRRRRSLGRLSYFSHMMGRLFARYTPPGAMVLEIGCGDSAWVPFLAARGCRVWGIDYSPAGLALVDARLRASGLSARLVQGDALGPNDLPTAAFDLVYSLGVVEHFRDPVPVLRRFAEYTRPGGLVLTLVPNLSGIWGSLQARLDRSVYDVHVPHDAARLDRIHADAGMRAVEPAHYVGVFGLSLLHSPRLAARAPRVAACLTGAGWITQQAIAWPSAVLLGRHADSARTSSHIVGVYARGVGGTAA